MTPLEPNTMKQGPSHQGDGSHWLAAPRITYIIMLWREGVDMDSEPPEEILGPLTEQQMRFLSERLTKAQRRVRRITTDPPDWSCAL